MSTSHTRVDRLRGHATKGGKGRNRLETADEEAKAGEELDEFDGEEGDYEGEEDDWDNESDDSNFVGMIDTQSLPWAELALQCARDSLKDCLEVIGETRLYSFRVNPANYRVSIRLDKMQDKYGSPSMEDLTVFSRNFNNRLEENNAPEEIEVEVSSPGAERLVLVEELGTRFDGLPMEVYYENAEGENQMQIVDLVSVDKEREMVVWHLADVRANRPDGKGRKLSKKKLAAEILIPVGSIRQINLHVDL
eukprot:CAMPEP_0114233838 /NCGR_PEP_ID=MMETSP0058-20121206/5396_1 /TAXON_ID=36894 /ORGANISM="Pyramimonas parkeae, CCMP726" /LENGTH=249 /DNA_ID=CAMNT_0001345491 /DNA_START=251 /DNA_END=1000 /DNA_ORIENTATION=-